MQNIEINDEIGMFSGSLVALVTPLLDSGQIDYKALDFLLEFHLSAGTDGLVPLGSTGEGWAFSDEERKQFIGHIIEYIDGRIPVIVGVGSNSTQLTIASAQKMLDLGCDAILVICPYYNMPTQEGIYQHFKALATTVDIPIIIYNHPGRTGSDILPDTVSRLAQLENIIGLKEAVTDAARFTELGSLCSANFALYSGDDMSCLSLLQEGAQGVISVTANIVPQQMHAMTQAVINGDWELANDVHRQLVPLFNALAIETNPIPLKWALSQMGYILNNLHLPLTPLSKEAQPMLEDVLYRFNLLKKDSCNAKIG